MALVEQIPAETYLIRRCISFDIRLHSPSDNALAEARALYAEGLTMAQIAELFGVSRQRVAALLRSSDQN